MKHAHFDSIYRPNFEVVEQRQGHTSFYPHTDQLPVLHRALNLEFLGGLPGRLSSTNKRADDFRKIVLHTAALMFCSSYNSTRADGLCLLHLLDRDRVTRVSIVQHVTDETRKGLLHHFRFYAGPDFSTDIYLNGKRVFFADHALQRFSARVPNPIGTDLRAFILFFFGSPIISLNVGPGPAFIMPYDPSLLALPFKETEHEYIVTSCLTLNEIHSMELQLPPRAYNHHYDLPYRIPRVRNWLPTQLMNQLWRRYDRKDALPPATSMQPPRETSWHRMASFMTDLDKKEGHGSGSRLAFVDDLPGPNMIAARPDQQIVPYDELAGYKQQDDSYDWDSIFAESLGLTPEEAKRYCDATHVPVKMAA